MKKSLNELVQQFRRVCKHQKRYTHNWDIPRIAFQNTLKSRYGISNPHEGKRFISKYGRDYKM